MVDEDLCKANILMSLLRVVEIHEHSVDTFHHSDRVASVSHAIGLQAGLSDKELSILWRAALLHDIGKVGVVSEVLLSPKKLHKKERDLINRHPQWGYYVLRTTSYFHEEANVVLDHHEYWDGKGYPRQIKGENINFLARIVHIADVYDALITFRNYKDGWSPTEATSYIYVKSEKMFDPDIVPLFLKARESERVATMYANWG